MFITDLTLNICNIVWVREQLTRGKTRIEVVVLRKQEALEAAGAPLDHEAAESYTEVCKHSLCYNMTWTYIGCFEAHHSEKNEKYVQQEEARHA